MKLIRFGTINAEKPGIQLTNGIKLDVSAFTSDYNEEFFGNNGIEKLKKWLESNQDTCPVVGDDIRLGSPLSSPSTTVCVGLNYAKHAAESGMEVPKEPVLFFKASSAIVGPFDDIVIPKGSTKTDWEVELAVVIGKKASYVSEKDAMNHVAGYVLHNDVSERNFQIERSGQWVKGKSCDTFAPIGPFIATTDEISDPNNLNLWLKLNGEEMQNSSTSDFIFNIQHVVSYISQFMTLYPGTIITTGTPAGTAMEMSEPKFLQNGDKLSLKVDFLGEQNQLIV